MNSAGADASIGSAGPADLDRHWVDVLVIGAGVAGLTAAIRLEDAVHAGAIRSYWIADAAKEAGGVIRTVEQDGYLLEDGPDMFFAEKPEVTEMAGRLGLGRELIQTNPLARRSFVAVRGRLKPLPAGFFLTAPSQLRPFLASGIIGPAAKFRMMLEPFVPAKKTLEDESVAAFVRRRFGAAALRRLAQPMVGGIYAGDPEQLSAKWALPKFVDWERRCGSVVWGLKTRGADTAIGTGVSGPRYSLFQSFRKGMGALVGAMTGTLRPDRLKLGSPVTHLEAVEGGWSAQIGGQFIRCRSVIVAAPAASAAKLLLESSPRLSDLLGRMRSQSCAVVQVGWDRARVRHPLDGLGFVVPAEDNLPLMAGSFASVKFEGRAPRNKVLFRFFAGGAFGRKWADLSQTELWNAIRPQASQLLGLEGEPDFVRVVYYRESMPQYVVGHDDWADQVRSECARLTGLEICGAMMQGVGVPDVLRDGSRAAEAALEKLKDRFGVLNSI